MKDAIQHLGTSIHCDACDYKEAVEDATTIDESSIGTKCPQCGAVIITAEDVTAHKEMLEMVASMSALLPPVDDDATMKVEVSIDTNGKIKEEGLTDA